MSTQHYVIPKQDRTSYLNSLNEWLPAQARVDAANGDIRAERLVIIWRRYRAFGEPGDWRCFIVARRLYLEGREGKR